MKSNIPVFYAFALISLPHTANAQESEIVVSGAPLPRSISSPVYSGVTLERDRITNSASNRIEDVLKDVAGLAQFRRTDARSANATSQGATLRGLGGNASSRALLVLDGVPQSDPFGGWITWPAFAPNRIERVVVTRGAGSGIYGSGALAGTIEFESLEGDARSAASITYGSRNSLDADALVAGKLGAGNAFLSVTYGRGDGFIPIVQSQRGSADIASPYEQASAALRFVFPVGKNTELQATGLAFTDRRERGTALSTNGGDGADASVRLVHSGPWRWSALGYLQIRKFQSRFVSVSAARDSVTQTVDQFNIPSTGSGARLELRPPAGKSLELRLGGDWRRTSGETRELFTYVAGQPTRIRAAGGLSETFGLFGEASYALGKLTLTGGARADHWSIRDGHLIERALSNGTSLRNEIAPNRSGWETTGRVGASYKFGDVTARAAAYLGWRLPTLNELYRPFRVGTDATAANSALNPERLEGIEAGIDWQTADGLHLGANIFSNRLNDAIANVTIASGPGTFPGVGVVSAGGLYRQRLNIDAIQSRGIELDGSYKSGDWALRASYALTDARVRASGLAAGLNGLRPAQVAKHNAIVTLGWKGLSATARYSSSQFEDDQNLRTLGSALTFDAVAKFLLSPKFSLVLRGENLTDTQVDAAISATGVIERATPQTFWLGVQTEF